MSEPVYSLDDVQEYFEFIVKGHTYRFRHLNTEEIDELTKAENDEEKSKNQIFQYISKVDEASPDFEEISKSFIVPHWRKFRAMLETEFGAKVI